MIFGNTLYNCTCLKDFKNRVLVCFWETTWNLWKMIPWVDRPWFIILAPWFYLDPIWAWFCICFTTMLIFLWDLRGVPVEKPLYLPQMSAGPSFYCILEVFRAGKRLSMELGDTKFFLTPEKVVVVSRNRQGSLWTLHT